MRNSLARALATWFGCGYFPFAPGTVASVAAVAIGWLLAERLEWRPPALAALALAILGPAVWAAHVVAAESQATDPAKVVVDEVVGQWVAMAGATALNWKTCAAAFVLFRLFDIWKPAPVRQLERLHGGAGIVADDVMAGVYAALVLFVAGCFNL
jgi:phosphatidylglycerophosphatase A